jgi:hypothetical protein
MSFRVDDIVPWGRSFEEYVAMFGLTESDLAGSILGCADGLAAFNAELTRRGGTIVSVDPIYALGVDSLRRRIEATFDTVLAQMRRSQQDYVWSSIPSVEELGRVRREAMETFLSDYESGKAAGRYVPGELPDLPLEDGSFDIAVCSHFLFVYPDRLPVSFHVEAVLEMLRVAREVRVFPLVTLEGGSSRPLRGVIEELAARGFTTQVRRVDYEFQRGGNEMLRVVR